MKMPVGILMALAVSVRAANFYVAPDGKDTNPGTRGKPFATIVRARDEVRTLTHGEPKESITVYLRGGTYRIDEPIVFGPEDSGTENFPITYAAVPGETPVISGGAPITGWRLVEDEPELPAKSKGQVYVADVPRGWRFHLLYVNGKMMPVARMIRQITDPFSWPRLPQLPLLDETGALVTFPPNVDLAGLSGNGDVEMIYLNVNYWNSIVELRSIDAKVKTARGHSRMPNLWGQKPVAGQVDRFNIQNAVKYLSAPGQWCVNSEKGKAYYWPPSGRPPVEVVASRPYELVRLQGMEENGPWVHHMAFRGLTFEYSDRMPEAEFPPKWIIRNSENPDAAFYMIGVEDIIVENNTFRNVGAYAAAGISHCQRVRIARNEMFNLGCGGVSLTGYGVGSKNGNHDNVVTLNNIHDIGLAPYYHSAAITLFRSQHDRISYNYIYNTPYVGIVNTEAEGGEGAGAGDVYGHWGAMYQIRQGEPKMYFGNNNTIEKNIVSQFMTIMRDGGALYSWGKDCGLNVVWQYNVVRRTLTTTELMWPLYLDNMTVNATMKGNRVWSVARDNDYKHQTDRDPNTWVDNVGSYPQKPAGYDQLLNSIKAEVAAQGGWRGTLDFTYDSSLP